MKKTNNSDCEVTIKRKSKMTSLFFEFALGGMMMNKLNELLKSKRKEMKLSLRDASKLIGISHSYLSTLEKGIDPRSNTPIKPTPSTLKLISEAYNISYTKLMELSGYIEDTSKTTCTDNPNTKKTIDLGKNIDEIKNSLDKETEVLFNGEPMSPEAIESVLEALEFCKKQAKILNKRFIPKKHRTDEE